MLNTTSLSVDSKLEDLQNFLHEKFDFRYNVLSEMPGYKMTATDIFNTLQKRFPAVFRGVKPQSFGRVLTRIGAKKMHTEFGNVYDVKKMSA